MRLKIYLTILLIFASILTSCAATVESLFDQSMNAQAKAEDGAILPVADTVPTMMMAILSPEPSQMPPKELYKTNSRFRTYSEYVRQEIYNFYEQKNFNLVWIKGKELSAKAKAIRDAVDNELYYTTPVSSKIFSAQPTKHSNADLVDFELRFTLNLLQKIEFIRNGLTNISGSYGVSANKISTVIPPLIILNDFYHSQNPQKILSGLVPQHPYYVPMREEVKRLQKIMSDNPPELIQSNRIMKIGDKGKDVQALIRRLSLSGDLTANYSSDSFDINVVNAVKDFQKRHGETADGAVGNKTLIELNRPVQDLIETLLVNFERIRKMNPLVSERYIRVNVPEFRLRFYEMNKPSMDMAVIVGRKSRPTPIFSDEISYIDFNPYWNVPYSIAVKDLLPKAQRDPIELVRKKIKVFSGNKELSVLSIDWSKYNRKNFPYHFRQDSGKDNALGTVKFMFPNRYAVYLHDTPTKNLFSKTVRSQSSGCVRVSQPVELAETLLKGVISRERIEQIFAAQRNKAVSLETKVPVSLEYLTASAPNFGLNQIRYNKDIYKYDAPLLQELRRRTNFLMGNGTAHP